MTKANVTHAAPMALSRFLVQNKLNILLLFIPAAMAVEVLRLGDLWLFLTAALAIVPLAGLIGEATEEIAERVGPALGGFLNATFGNATELIIALFALKAGLHEVVKASISGSIIGNLLLVLGLSMLAGGWGRDKQKFNRTSAGANAAMLFLAVVAMVMPAVFDLAVYHRLDEGAVPAPLTHLSLLVAIVLLLTYLASLVFSLKTHRNLFTGNVEAATPRLRMRDAIILLLASTTVTAIMAEFLVSGIHAATSALGLTEFFVGVIVVAVIGNAAEHFSAVVFARKGKMDLAVTIATSSSTQIALLVAPVLVIASFLFGNPMSLVFNAFEIMAIGLSVIILALVSLDGESNWFEGLQLVAVYIILGIIFFFVPAPAGNTSQTAPPPATHGQP